VARDSVLDLVPLAAALKKISAEDRRALLVGLGRLAAAAPVSNRLRNAGDALIGRASH
jgi:hypothetical protein